MNTWIDRWIDRWTDREDRAMCVPARERGGEVAVVSPGMGPFADTQRV